MRLSPAKIPSTTCAACASTNLLHRAPAMAASWRGEYTVAENSDLERRLLRRQSGSWGLGCDPDIGRPSQRDQRGRSADDQQSHGVAGRDLGARSLEEAQRCRTVDRQRLRAERHHGLDTRLEKEWLADGRQEAR